MTRGPAKGEAYGAASVMNLFDNVDFPVSKQEVLDRFGNEEIHWTKDSTRQLRNCIEPINREQFNGVTEITEAISQTCGKNS